MTLLLTTPSLKDLFIEYEEKLSSDLFVQLKDLLDKEEIEASIELVHPLTKARFAHGVLYELLGLLYIENKNFKKSCEALEKAHSFSSVNVTVLTYLGISYARQSKISDAVICFEKILKIQNYTNLDMISFVAEFYNSTFLWKNTLKIIASVECQVDERVLSAEFNALKCLGREKEIISKINSLSEKDLSRNLYVILAKCYQNTGNTAGLLKTLKEGLRHYPQDSQMLWMLLDNDPDVIDTAILNTISESFLEAISKSNIESKDDKIFYSLCLNKIYEKKKDFEKSFSFLTTGHSICLENSSYNIEADKFVLRKMIDINYEKVDLPKKLDDMTIIFLIGLPNSGTCELGNLLKSVTKSFSGEDVPFLPAAINHSNFLNSGSKDDLINIKNLYFKFIRDAGFSGNFFIDNNPLNFRFLPVIRKVFPSCIIINTKRNLKHNILSCFISNFNNNDYDFTCDQTTLNEYAQIYKEAYNQFKLNEVAFEYWFDFDEFNKNPKLEASKFIEFFTKIATREEFKSIGDDLFRTFIAIENQIRQETSDMVAKSEVYQKYITKLFVGL